MALKICTRCNVSKEHCDFRKIGPKANKYGPNATCYECDRSMMVEYMAKKKNRIR